MTKVSASILNVDKDNAVHTFYDLETAKIDFFHIDVMDGKFVENNNIEVYRLMGVEFFRDYIGGYLADTVLKAAVFVVLFVVVYLALKVLVVWLDLIAKLPILSGINKMAGAVLGGVQALIFIWILCIVLTIFSRTELGQMIFTQVNASPWLSWLYDHNMLANLVLGLIRSLL